MRQVSFDALRMASTKNLTSLYNARYVDSGIKWKLKGVPILGAINSSYEKLKEEEEKKRLLEVEQLENRG